MPEFTTPAPITAVLDIPAGHVRLIAADRPDTTVEILPANASKSRDVKAAEQITADYGDGVLRIASTAKSQPFGAPGYVEVTVQLPAGSRVEGKVASADFRGVGRFGDVTVESAHGAVKIDEAASAHLKALAGDVSVGRLTGPAEISTGKGDIRIAEAVRGAVVLRAEAGDVTVEAAAGVSASLDAGTPHGRIRNSLKNADGVAELTIHATTSSGDITARSH